MKEETPLAQLYNLCPFNLSKPAGNKAFFRANDN